MWKIREESTAAPRRDKTEGAVIQKATVLYYTYVHHVKKKLSSLVVIIRIWTFTNQFQHLNNCF